MFVTKSPLRTRAGESFSDKARASLRLVLLETVLWVSPRADASNPRSSLRSPLLAPYIFNASRHDTVHDVASARHLQLEGEGRIVRRGGFSEDIVDASTLGLDVVDLRQRLSTGRLLVWERDTTIDDGAGQAETNGYLDPSDMPPWDTWVAYVETTGAPWGDWLVSWVPEPFVPSVGRAIGVNVYDALYWLTDSKLPIADVLRADDLLV